MVSKGPQRFQPKFLWVIVQHNVFEVAGDLITAGSYVDQTIWSGEKTVFDQQGWVIQSEYLNLYLRKDQIKTWAGHKSSCMAQWSPNLDSDMHSTLGPLLTTVYTTVMCESGHLESESKSRHFESESSWIRIHPYFLESGIFVRAYVMISWPLVRSRLY